MYFTFTGAILSVLPQSQGTSANGTPWVKQEYVIEDINQQHPSRVCFEVFGAERIRQFAICQGELLTVTLNITSRQSKDGRWFNQVACFRVVHHQSLSPEMAQGYQPRQGSYQPRQDYQSPSAPVGEASPSPFPSSSYGAVSSREPQQGSCQSQSKEQDLPF